MRFIISGRNINLTPGLQSMVEEKLGKLQKYFQSDVEVQVTLSTVEKERKKIEVTIPMKGGTVLRAEEVNSDMYTAIDLVQSTIIRQLRRHKTRLLKQTKGSFTPNYVEEEEEDHESEDDTIRIVRTKHFAMKPMDPEEACLQMEMLGHTFFVFLNSETDQINVVYKRGGNTYGIIEPEF